MKTVAFICVLIAFSECQEIRKERLGFAKLGSYGEFKFNIKWLYFNKKLLLFNKKLPVDSFPKEKHTGIQHISGGNGLKQSCYVVTMD